MMRGGNHLGAEKLKQSFISSPTYLLTYKPSFIKYTLEKLSELKSIEFEDLENITNNNFNSLFF